MRRNGHNKLSDPTILANLVIPEMSLDDHQYASLKLRLDCYDDIIIAQKFDKGAGGGLYALDPAHVAAALAGMTLSSPLLPRNCLFWQKAAGGERIGIYCEPQIWTVNVVAPGPNDDPKRKRGVGRQAWRVPLPGLVWIGQGVDYWLYALKGTDWPGPETALWAAPVPNMSEAICRGNVEFPAAAASTMWSALALFFESDFNDHLSNGKSLAHRDSVLEQWAVLYEAGAETWPEDDLVSTRLTLKGLMEGV
jgi:PRTRC genetic system protein B